MVLHTIVITGRKEKVLMRDPLVAHKYVQYEDTSPMTCHYFTLADAKREAPKLAEVLAKNPNAQATLPDGRTMPLAHWLEEAKTGKPVEVPAAIEAVAEVPAEKSEKQKK